MNTNKYSNKREIPQVSPLKEILAEAEFLRQTGVDPAPLVTAEFIDGDGFELGENIREDCRSTAFQMCEQKKHFRPPQVDPNYAITIGVHPELGYPIQFNINDMGHTGFIGPTKTGKNNTGQVFGDGFLRLNRNFTQIAQKGDEFNGVNLTPNSIYMPHQLDPWNDLTVVGNDRVAFWTTLTEAIAIPMGIAPQTQPEFPLLLNQMFHSSPDPSWHDLKKTFHWKSQQPDGREKHSTAMGVINAYSVWLGDRAYVRRGYDIRQKYRHIIRGIIGASLDKTEVTLGIILAREMFEAIQRGHSRVPRLGIFIPEAQLLYDRALEYARRGTFSFLLRFLSMSNSMGIIMLLAFQSASRISDFAIGNIASYIVFCQDSFNEALFCARLLGLGTEAVADLMSLPPGVAYAKTPGWKASVKVRIPLLPLGPSLTPADMETRYSADYRDMRAQADYAPRDEAVDIINWQEISAGNTQSAESTKDSRKRTTPAPGMLEEHYQLASDIRNHPDDGLLAHYDRMGPWGIERGNRILGDLKAAGYVTIQREQKPRNRTGRPRLIATLTIAGNNFLKGYEARERKN